LHDTVKLERLGIAALPVATREFMTAARAQAGALGRADLDAVYVEHPIQDQTPQEIAAKAEMVLDEIVSRLTSLMIISPNVERGSGHS
jgi:hypothetical protein